MGTNKNTLPSGTGNNLFAGLSNLPREDVYCYACLIILPDKHLLPCSEKYWAYFPDPPNFQVVTWNNDPLRVHTNQPQLLGGSYTSYTTDEYPINFNFTFRGLADDLPVCFNFPSDIESFIIPPKEGCVGASKKAVLTHSPASGIEHRGRLALWVLQARMPGALDPHEFIFHRPPPGYPSCYNTEPSDAVWNTIDDRTGYPI